MTDYIVTCDEETAAWIGNDVDSMRPKACIDYFEELGNAHRSLSIEAFLTNNELMALIRELLCSADCETEVNE